MFKKGNLVFINFFKKMDISGLRKPYNSRDSLFVENEVELKDPFFLFEKWFAEAQQNDKIEEPNAACVATATKTGLPSNRYLLCKGFGKDIGFKFFTNFGSKKGIELTENPHAAICFYWPPLKKSVRIEGSVQKLSFEESEAYFKSRPYYSQIAAVLSKQSQPVEGREVFDQLEQELMQKYSEGNVPKPDYWGGFTVIPNRFEFWQGQTTRIHDRLQFRKLKEGEALNELITHKCVDDWFYERLFP